jgi:cyclohexyl-isocyanide hydratase
MSETVLRSGMLVFPNLTQLDLTGPYEVLARLPGAETRLLWKNLDPVRSEHGLTILPDTNLSDCPPLDLVLVPGGAGIDPLLEDGEALTFLRHAAAAARYVVGICTGSLVLGAAGLLRGRRAATHWMSRELLRAFGAEPVAERVVVDGNIITGGGVTAGIDFALTVAAQAFSPELAQAIQLGIEYDPHPPFDAGAPERADPALVAKVRAQAATRQAERQTAVDTASAKINH